MSVLWVSGGVSGGLRVVYPGVLFFMTLFSMFNVVGVNECYNSMFN